MILEINKDMVPSASTLSVGWDKMGHFSHAVDYDAKTTGDWQLENEATTMATLVQVTTGAN
jgi:hypothetical protein